MAQQHFNTTHITRGHAQGESDLMAVPGYPAGRQGRQGGLPPDPGLHLPVHDLRDDAAPAQHSRDLTSSLRPGRSPGDKEPLCSIVDKRAPVPGNNRPGKRDRPGFFVRYPQDTSPAHPELDAPEPAGFCRRMEDLDTIAGQHRHQRLLSPENDFEFLIAVSDADIPHPRSRPVPGSKRPGFLHCLHLAPHGVRARYR